jgi:hypothetical protein
MRPAAADRDRFPWLGLAIGGLLLGLAVGAAGGLLRRRLAPERVPYRPPEPARGTAAVGPHRGVLGG